MSAFYPLETFHRAAMGDFMRRPDIYGGIFDAMAPPAEEMDFEAHLMDPRLWTMAAMYGEHIVGFVQFFRRTSVAAEATAGFHPQVPGVAKKAFGAYAIQQVWDKMGLLTIWGIVAADNRPARVYVTALGFKPEAVLTKAIVRPATKWSGPGIRDMIVYAIHKPEAANGSGEAR